ncbi:multicopper oxidase domain-containing protein [Clostridiaceae bacterium M8S5]|nr:multicopper oxidase domain-containing protein [Clostridiaceae bacterium M8S5]
MAVRHYVLISTDGFQEIATQTVVCDTLRREVYVWGFVGGLLEVDGKIVPENAYLDYRNPANWPAILATRGTAKIPSPIVYAEAGDKLYITLINVGFSQIANRQNHTIHIHGAQVATTVDGFPETSLNVPVWEPDSSGNFSRPPSTTYLFDSPNPGTYMYHCHVRADDHIQMGMYGSLFVYPSVESLKDAGIEQDPDTRQWYFNNQLQPQIPKTATNRNFAYNDIHTFFDKEYVYFFSDIDYEWHQSHLYGYPYNSVDYKPDYWLINGRAYPDTLLPYPKEPGSDVSYNAYVHVSAGQSFLLRMSNLAYQPNPFHIHGFHYFIAGEDAQLSPFLKIASQNNDFSLNLAQKGFTINVAPGQTKDIIVPTSDQRAQYRNYIVNGQDGITSQCSQMKFIKRVNPSSIANVPTEPVNCPNPKTITSIDICNQPLGDPNDNYFPQFYPMHNHSDYQNTNYGNYPGGQIALYQVDPPNKILPPNYPCNSAILPVKKK